MTDETRKRLVSVTAECAYYALLIGALWFLSSPTRPPAVPWFWHTLQRVCQSAAYRIGRVGIHAEKAYGVAIERVRQ